MGNEFINLTPTGEHYLGAKYAQENLVTRLETDSHNFERIRLSACHA